MAINTVSAMEEEDIKIEDTKLGIGLREAMNLLSSVSLASVNIGDFLVVMRSDFDLTISGEPYTGLVLLLNLMTGKFLSRIWNQTVATGTILRENDLMEACENHFGQGRPCLGCPQREKFKHGKEDFLISQTPIPRRIATGCLKVLGKDTHSSIYACSECIRLASVSTSGMNDVCKDDEAQCSLNKMNSGECVSLTGLKTEYIDEYVADDMEEIVTKPDINNIIDFQEGDRVGHGEIESKIFPGLNKHPSTHQNRTKTMKWKECDICGKELYNNHLNQHSWCTRKFSCEKCPFRGSSDQDLINHINEGHIDDHRSKRPSTLQDKEQVEMRKRKEKVRNADKKFSCKLCSYTSSRNDRLQRHIKGQHYNIREHVCKLCGYATLRKYDLNKHMEAKHEMGEKKFKCDACPYACFYRSSLTKHIEVVHDQVKKHVCEECGSAFGQKGGLTEHIKRVHSNIRNFVCDECGHATATKNHLESHKKVHSKEEKKYKCDKCPYASHFTHMLKKHIAIVHDKIRKYVCEDCGYAASSSGNLGKHMKAIHQHIRNHVCQECGYAASEISNLKSHIERIHKR